MVLRTQHLFRTTTDRSQDVCSTHAHTQVHVVGTARMPVPALRPSSGRVVPALTVPQRVPIAMHIVFHATQANTTHQLAPQVMLRAENVQQEALRIKLAWRNVVLAPVARTKTPRVRRRARRATQARSARRAQRQRCRAPRAPSLTLPTSRAQVSAPMPTPARLPPPALRSRHHAPRARTLTQQ